MLLTKLYNYNPKTKVYPKYADTCNIVTITENKKWV